MDNEILKQRTFFSNAAPRYDEKLYEKDEHFFALGFLVGILDYLEIESILDIGSGTGRAIRYIKKKRPDIRVVGVEPVGELRKIGLSKGLTPSELVDGDATELKFDDAEFDLVCEFGVLHHIKNPHIAVAEMLRVSKKSIYISDSNNFGQGHSFVRLVKQCLKICGLWKVAAYLNSGCKGYMESEGDGIYYSYSVYNNYCQIRRDCSSVHMVNTLDAGPNLFRTASHVALLGIK